MVGFADDGGAAELKQHIDKVEQETSRQLGAVMQRLETVMSQMAADRAKVLAAIGAANP